MTDTPRPMTHGMGDHDEMLRRDAEEAAVRERKVREAMKPPRAASYEVPPAEALAVEQARVAAVHPRKRRSRWWPLHVMTSSQAKLVGSALATILVWMWARAGGDEIPGEVGAAVAVMFVALVDMTLGGKKDKP